MTGNTWDIIKIQTKTNQLMMGNRKDHIRVRGQRQRKTKSDTDKQKVILDHPTVCQALDALLKSCNTAIKKFKGYIILYTGFHNLP